jgi:hypothetical protein
MYKLLIIFVCSISIISAASAEPKGHHSDSSRGTTASSHSDAGRPGPSNQAGSGYHPSQPSTPSGSSFTPAGGSHSSAPTGTWMQQAQAGSSYHPGQTSPVPSSSSPTGSWMDQARAGSSYHAAGTSTTSSPKPSSGTWMQQAQAQSSYRPGQTASTSPDTTSHRSGQYGGTTSRPGSSTSGGSHYIYSPRDRSNSTDHYSVTPSARGAQPDSHGSSYRSSGSDRPRSDRYSPAVGADNRHSPVIGSDNRHSPVVGSDRSKYASRPPAAPRPASYRPPSRDFSVSYAKAHYAVPHGYVPPVYRGGHFYYHARPAAQPFFFGFWSFDYDPYFCARSVYFNYGLFPYIQITRVEVVSPPTVVYVEQPVYVGGTYYSTSRFSGLDSVLGDIRSAWIAGRYDLIESHVTAGREIAVFLDGSYDYSITSDDYLSMTRDALGSLETASFVWDRVNERTDGQVTAFGAHIYRADGEPHTVYVSYTLRRSGSSYYITEVGSSDSPLE